MTGSWREGRVVDAAANPVASASVVIVGGPVAVPEIAVRADADGRFRVRLPEGSFRFRATTPDHRQGETESADDRFQIVVGA